MVTGDRRNQSSDKLQLQHSIQLQSLVFSSCFWLSHQTGSNYRGKRSSSGVKVIRIIPISRVVFLLKIEEVHIKSILPLSSEELHGSSWIHCPVHVEGRADDILAQGRLLASVG